MSRYLDKQLVRETSRGRSDRAADLIDRGADVNRLAPDCFTPLMRAAYHGHLELVELLLERGGNPNGVASDGASALFWACVRAHEPVARLLIAAGADVNAVRRSASADPAYNGPSVLTVAISNMRSDLVLDLVRAGASLDYRYLGRDLFHHAEGCHKGSLVLELRRAQIAYLRSLLSATPGNKRAADSVDQASGPGR